MPEIAILTNDAHGVFQSQVIAGARKAAAREGFVLSLHTPSQPALADASGILVIANAALPRDLAALRGADKPITFVSHYDPALPIPSVVFNNAQGVRALVDHLVNECGRSRFGFVRGIAGQFDSVEREAAFRHALLRHTLDHATYLDGEFDPAIAADAVMGSWSAGARFDAVIASDYVMARTIVGRLREVGVRVPQEVAVVGFGDDPATRDEGITTVAADVHELGGRAARQLIAQINGNPIIGVTILSVRLMVRASSQQTKPR